VNFLKTFVKYQGINHPKLDQKCHRLDLKNVSFHAVFNQSKFGWWTGAYVWGDTQPPNLEFPAAYIFSSNSAVIVSPLNQWVAGELTIFRVLDPPYKSLPACSWFYWSTWLKRGPWGWPALGAAKWSTSPANIAWEAGDNVCFLVQMARHEDHPWLSLGSTEKMYDAIFGRPASLPFFSEMQVQIWMPDI
jgi:hypothetical protein